MRNEIEDLSERIDALQSSAEESRSARTPELFKA